MTKEETRYKSIRTGKTYSLDELKELWEDMENIYNTGKSFEDWLDKQKKYEKL